jgi:hypothetical protein
MSPLVLTLQMGVYCQPLIIEMHGALVGRLFTVDNRVFGETLDLMSLCAPQIPHEQPTDWTQSSQLDDGD